MKIRIDSAALLSDAAKSLRNALAARGSRVSLSRAQQAVAYALGFESLHSMQKATAHPPLPLDHEVPADEKVARRLYQASRLMEFFSVSEEVAKDLVAEAQPSGNRRDRAAGAGASQLPPDLRVALMEMIRENLQGGRGGSFDELVRQATLQFLCHRRGQVAGNLSALTVDDYLSRPQPNIVEEHRMLNPGMLEIGMCSDGVVEWNPRGADRGGWDIVLNRIRRQCADACLRLHPEYARGSEREKWIQIATALGCEYDDLIQVLRDSDIPRLVADSILAEGRARISGRSVMDLVVLSRNSDGFFAWHQGIEGEDTFDGEFWRPKEVRPEGHPDFRRFSLRVREADVEVEVTRERSHEDYEEGGGCVAFYFVLAKAVIGERVVGVVRGEILIDRTHGSMQNDNFYSAAESLTGDLTHLAHIVLTQHMSAFMLFAPGDVFYLSHWEIVPELSGTGFAFEFLKAVCRELRRRHGRLASVAYELRPAQFPHPFDRKLPSTVVRAYDDARQRLATHLAGIGFESLVSFRGYAVCFDVTPDQEALTDNQRYVQHMRKPPWLVEQE